MNINHIQPPRVFKAGVHISHCADIELKADEQVTFVTESKKEYDVVRKSWGFFATPSINNRLKKFGFRTAIIEDSIGKIFLCLVEEGKEEEFESFLKSDESHIFCWLDDQFIKKFKNPEM